MSTRLKNLKRKKLRVRKLERGGTADTYGGAGELTQVHTQLHRIQAILVQSQLTMQTYDQEINK
jgi:hypothetical protein